MEGSGQSGESAENLNGTNQNPLPPIVFRADTNAVFGTEGYGLDVSAGQITITAQAGPGYFYAVQTLRQLLPPAIEYSGTLPYALSVASVRIRDHPRFEWRGAMLDVSGHFFGPADVKRYMDLMALYKLNRLHLHLSDDQGWRLEIPGRPALTDIGARTQVGGGEGGYYTLAEWDDLVAYAASRNITIVPEIDMPGHTNAALASIAELNCDGRRTEPYTGIDVGFSSLCVDREETYAFVDDVVREIAQRSPGAYFHVGGDEVKTLSATEYNAFMDRAAEIVARHGKLFMAWDGVAETRMTLPPGAVIQVWRPQTADTGQHLVDAVSRGARLILSPADRIYVDMKYDASSRLGLRWAGFNDTRDAYDWDPATLVSGVPESAILGVEAPLWTETAETIRDLEWLAFPRLPGVAEIGWTAHERRDWTTYRTRLAAHGPRWDVLGINYYPSPLVF